MKSHVPMKKIRKAKQKSLLTKLFGYHTQSIQCGKMAMTLNHHQYTFVSLQYLTGKLSPRSVIHFMYISLNLRKHASELNCSFNSNFKDFINNFQ